jgi:hypothetical protein
MTHPRRELRAVIPGRAEGASPESRKAENPDVLDSGPAAIARQDARERAYGGVPE